MEIFFPPLFLEFFFLTNSQELKEKITKRLEKWTVTTPTKSVTATFREKTIQQISALDSKLFYTDPKNFDGIDFMYSLSTVTATFLNFLIFFSRLCKTVSLEPL